MTFNLVDRAYIQLVFVCFVFVLLGYYLNDQFAAFYNWDVFYIIAAVTFAVGSFITFFIYPIWVKKE